MPSFWHRLHFSAWTLLVLLLGYGLGTFVLRTEKAAMPAPVQVVNERTRLRAPVVHIAEINAGNIVGFVGTGARLVIGGEPVTPRPDRTFSVDAGRFLVNVIDVPIPRGANFVASRRGRKYYPVESGAGRRLVPENRIYFRSAEEAEAMGYERSR